MLKLSVSVFFVLAISSAGIVAHEYNKFDKCIAKQKVDGCSIPFNTSFPYRVVFKSACNRHDVCYRCGNKFSWSRKDCDRGFLYDMYRECEERQWIKKHIKSREKHTEIVEESGTMQQDSKEVKSSVISQRSSESTIENQKSRCHKSKKRKPRSEVEGKELHERQHRPEVKVEVSKKRPRRSEVKVNDRADQKRSKQKDILSQHEKQLKEIENDLIEEATLESAARRHQDKNKVEETGKKRDKSGSKKETKTSKINHSNDKRQGKEDLIKETKTLKIGKEKFTNRNTTTENHTKIHDNSSVLEGQRHCNGSNNKCRKSQNATHHAKISHADKDMNSGKIRYNDLDLNNNSTSRHEKIMKILTWLDELLKSEKEMYAHKKKGKKKHKCSKKSKTSEKSLAKMQSRRGRMKKRTSKTPYVYEDDIDEVEKKGSDVTRTESDIMKSGSSCIKRGKNEGNNNSKKGNDIEKKESNVKGGRSDIIERGSSVKKRGKHVKNTGEDKSKRGNDIEKKESNVKGGRSDNIERGSSVKKRGKHVKNTGEDKSKRGNDIEKKESNVKEGRTDDKERGSSVKKRGKHVKTQGNNNSKRENDIENEGSDVKEGRSDNKKRGSSVKKRERRIKTNGINNKKRGNGIIDRETDVKSEDSNVMHAGSDVKRRKRISKKEIEKRLISHCKLTAHLYYLAVRGFGQRFYKQDAAQWCHHDCVEDHGLPHIKKYNRQRKIM